MFEGTVSLDAVGISFYHFLFRIFTVEDSLNSDFKYQPVFDSDESESYSDDESESLLDDEPRSYPDDESKSYSDDESESYLDDGQMMPIDGKYSKYLNMNMKIPRNILKRATTF